MLFRFIHEVQIGDYAVFPSKSDRKSITLELSRAIISMRITTASMFSGSANG